MKKWHKRTPMQRGREDSVWAEWLRLWFCLTMILLVGILMRVGYVSSDSVKQALVGHAPKVNWQEHTQETLARIGELFHGTNQTEG